MREGLNVGVVVREGLSVGVVVREGWSHEVRHFKTIAKPFADTLAVKHVRLLC